MSIGVAILGGGMPLKNQRLIHINLILRAGIFAREEHLVRVDTVWTLTS